MSNKNKQTFPLKTPLTVDQPPRYQPPPQPALVQNQGILKNNPLVKDAKFTNPSKPQENLNKQQFQGFPYPYQIGLPIAHTPGQAPQELTSRPAQEEFYRQDMLKFVRKPEADAPRMVITDQRPQMQNLMVELRSLKDANQRLADDNQELRDLCCFLDDDRQKGRKLAREWQRFGRYTASVMRQEVSAYQSKLRELDNKQQELIKDNLELKELCLYLDEERGGATCATCGAAPPTMRDDGDGSSSSTNADEPNLPHQQFVGSQTNVPRRSASRERLLHENLARQRSTFNDQIMQYVRSLEQRVTQLEDDKRTLTHKINKIASTTNDPTLTVPLENAAPVLSGRPEAVVRALQVLEVREQLEREGRIADLGENLSDTASGDMDDGEKALVREMCNVVWRKLEEAPQCRR